MAKVQYNYVQRKKALSGQTGNETFDLPEKGFIPEIVVRVFSTPTASTSPALPISDAITKIEITDGSKVIKSLTGNQAHALEVYHRKPRRASTEKNDNAVEGYDDFILVLGKKVNGIEYAPDFSKFSQPQLKITWDYSLTATHFNMPVDADATPAIKVTILAKVVREGGKYTHGYIKSGQIYTWTSAASATTQTEVPIGEKLYGLMIEAGYPSKDWTEDVEQIKLDFDNGAWIPLDLYEEEIVPIQQEWFEEPFEIKWRADAKDANVVDVHMGYVTSISATPLYYVAGTKAHEFYYPSDTQGISTIKLMSGAEALVTYSQYSFVVQGFMPYQCWYAPVSKILDGGGDLIDTNAYSRIVLQTVSGSSVHTSSKPNVVAEYFVT